MKQGGTYQSQKSMKLIAGSFEKQNKPLARRIKKKKKSAPQGERIEINEVRNKRREIVTH